MERKFYKIFRKSTAARLLLLFSLLVGGGDFVWGQKSLPYSYGFEDTDITTKEWTMTSTHASTSTVTYPNGYNSSRCFRFWAALGFNNQYICTPELESSSTGLEITLYYNVNWTSGSSSRSFYIGYATSSLTEIQDYNYTQYNVSNADKNWHEITISIPEVDVKYIAIKYTDTNSHLYFDEFTISKADPHKAPINFTTSDVTANAATLTWTNPNSNAISWDIKYSTEENFDPKTKGSLINTTSGHPFVLENLVNGVTYYASIRAIYSDGKSEWSNNISFTPRESITINDGSNSSPYVPFPDYTNNSDFLTKSQILLPYSDISALKGKYIKELTFYATNPNINWGTATYDIYLLETTFNNWSYNDPFIDWSNFEKVAEGVTPEVKDGKLMISISPYLYNASNNENLVIGFVQTAASSSTVSSTWYGVTNYSSYYGAAYYNDGKERQAYSYVRPKLTINYNNPTTSVTLGATNYTTFACPRPLDLTTANLPAGLKAYKASVAGTTVTFSEVNQVVPANTGILLVGEAGQTYDIPFAESGTAPEGNAFEVNSTGGTFAAADGYTYFGLIKNSNPLTFGEFDPSSVAIPTNKAYLKVLTSSLPAESRQLTFLFDENETTAIKDLPTAGAKKADDAVFSITGQRVSTPTKGLYIINGKKYIIK